MPVQSVAIMTSKKNVNMWPGAIAASALPMAIGLYVMLSHAAFEDSSDWEALMPIALCFVFGTPISAWLACRSLNKQDTVEWERSVSAAISWAGIVHFVAGVIIPLVWVLVSLLVDPVRSGVTFILGTTMVLVVAYSILWLFITLPFSIFCGSVFWAVTKSLNMPTHKNSHKKSPELSPEA